MNSTKNNQKTMWKWAMYDWANSVYSLTITSAIFPVYYASVSKSAAIAAGSPLNGPYILDFWGIKINNSAAFSYVLSIAFLIVSIISPMLSGIADHYGAKKKFMQFFVYLGSLSCMAMWFFDTDSVQLGLLLFGMATVGFGGSLVFYNAFIPEIVSEDQMDKLSAKGFTYGYIGSVILLIINLIFILFPQILFDVNAKANEIAMQLHLTPAEAMLKAKSYYEGVSSRLAFLTVGIWWLGFSQITFSGLPKEFKQKKKEESLFQSGFSELSKVWNAVKKSQSMVRFLFGFFFTSMGLQTVMYVASLFGSAELKLSADKLIATILIIQLVAVLGAYLFSYLSKKWGNIKCLSVAIVVWTLVTIMAYLVQNEVQFYLLAALVGIIMGGSQSLFRSTYAKMIPEETHNHASYFSFFDIGEKIAIVLGTFAYGLIDNITNSLRLSALSLGAFFIVGFIFISQTKATKKA